MGRRRRRRPPSETKPQSGRWPAIVNATRRMAPPGTVPAAVLMRPIRHPWESQQRISRTGAQTGWHPGLDTQPKSPLAAAQDLNDEHCQFRQFTRAHKSLNFGSVASRECDAASLQIPYRFGHSVGCLSRWEAIRKCLYGFFWSKTSIPTVA